MEGKHVTLNLGSNDVLKRKLPDFNYDRNPIGMKWDNAFKILMFKFIESNIRELFICTIPNFVVPAADIVERFYKRIKIDCRLFFSEVRGEVRDAMNAQMQTFAQKFTRKGLQTRVITFERERFDRNRDGTRNIHIDRESQVQRLHIIRKLYKIYKVSLFQIGE